MSKTHGQHSPSCEARPETLVLLEQLQAGMEQLEHSDREAFGLFAAAVVRTVVNAGGVVSAINELNQRLAKNDLRGAVATAESVKEWLDGIENRWTMLETRYVM